MSKTDRSQDALEAAFAATRAHPPQPDAAFLARVVADADAVLESRARTQAPRPAAPAQSGIWGVFRGLGGWPAVAGLGAAMVTGLWIGVAPPDTVSETAGLILGDGVVLAFEPDLGMDLFPPDEEG